MRPLTLKLAPAFPAVRLAGLVLGTVIVGPLAPPGFVPFIRRQVPAAILAPRG